jgi:hypothetical protein
MRRLGNPRPTSLDRKLKLDIHWLLVPAEMAIRCFYHALPQKHTDRLPFRLPELANTRRPWSLERVVEMTADYMRRKDCV